MAIQLIRKNEQAKGAFNGGEIIENKPIGFDREGGALKAYSNLFYWANAEANTDSTIGLHPHQGFEIMSFVLKGQIRHYDTKGKNWIPLNAGDVQIIRAGKGISHAEFMAKDSAMFQIWFDPGLEKTLDHPASYDDYSMDQFPEVVSPGMRTRVIVGGESPLRMESPNVFINRIFAEKGAHQIELIPEQINSFYLLKGKISVGKEIVNLDDFLKISDAAELKFSADEEVELFHISTPQSLPYHTYAALMKAQMGR